MPKERFEFRIPFYKLLVGLLITVVPISIAGLYSVSQGNRSLQKTIGNYFAAISAGAAAEVSQFVHERVIDIGLLAADPLIIEAVTAANKSYQGASEQEITARFEKIDQAWNTPAGDAIAERILSTPASRALRRHVELDPRILRITVTDARGATVAASHKTSDYYQADEDYWQNIYAGGKGSISLTDVLYDSVTKSNYIGVGAPVFEEPGHRFIGTVDALIDVSSLSEVVYRSPIGPGARILLVKDDGAVIAAPGVSFAMGQKSEDYAAVADALGRPEERQSGFIVADMGKGGRRLIGFADTGLRHDYRNLGWIALVSQDTRHAFAAVRFVDRLMFAMSALGLLLVTLLIVYFALHRKLVITEIGHVTPQPQAAPGSAPAVGEAPGRGTPSGP